MIKNNYMGANTGIANGKLSITYFSKPPHNKAWTLSSFAAFAVFAPLHFTEAKIVCDGDVATFNNIY